jgi:hypothetical protein
MIPVLWGTTPCRHYVRITLLELAAFTFKEVSFKMSTSTYFRYMVKTVISKQHSHNMKHCG